MERGVKRSWVPNPRHVTWDRTFLPLPDPRLLHLGATSLKRLLCYEWGWSCVLDTLLSSPWWQMGKRPPEEILGGGTRPGLPRGSAAWSPPARPAPNLSFRVTWLLASCLVCRAGCLSCCLSRAMTTRRIPAGLLLSLGIRGGPQREPSS